MERQRIEHSDFRVFIGKWKTEGRVFQTSESPEMEIIGTDTYEPILDGFFILHKADVLIGKEKSQTLELMWFPDVNSQVCLQHYDNTGSSGLMSGKLENGEWKITGEELRFDGKFSENYDELSGNWYRMDNKKKWVNFIEIKLTRSSPI
jgi:Protein of unknown function (DUF1579)